MADRPKARHRFGGPWTIVKLEAVQQYLKAYNIALQGKPFQRLYVDAFAGSGRCDVRANGETVTISGSAHRALELDPPFDRYVFVEKSGRKCRALAELAASFPLRDVRIQHGEANDALLRIAAQWDRARMRAVTFLDPYGMHLDWRTLEALASTKAVDVWYLFPLSATIRQAAIDVGAVNVSKAQRLTRMLGTDTWRTDWYVAPPQRTLFDPPSDQRAFTPDQILTWVTRRLETVFPYVSPPLRLTIETPLGGKSPLYALFFAVSNPDPKATALAKKIANHILDAARRAAH